MSTSKMVRRAVILVLLSSNLGSPKTATCQLLPAALDPEKFVVVQAKVR